MKKLISLFMIAALVLAVSCKKDEQKVLAAADAKTALDNGTSSITSDLEGMTSTQGYQAISNVNNVGTPFGNPMKSTIAVLKSKNLKSLTTVASQDFNFDNAKGEWEYVAATDTVQKVAGSNVTDKLILHFPSDSTKMSDNDAILTVLDYAQQSFTETTGTPPYTYTTTTILPTKITANVTVKGTLVIDVVFSASYTTNKRPSSISATISIVPYSFHAGFTESGTKQTADAWVKKDSKTIAAVGATLTYPTAALDKPDYFDGYVQIEDLKLSGNANIKALSDTTKPKPVAADFNANAHLAILRVSDGAKIGDVKAFDGVDKHGDPEITPFIVYSDGNKDSAAVYLRKIQNQLPKDITKK
jgi:hypothetical protein